MTKTVQYISFLIVLLAAFYFYNQNNSDTNSPLQTQSTKNVQKKLDQTTEIDTKSKSNLTEESQNANQPTDQLKQDKENIEIPDDLKTQLNSNNIELPEDLKRQLAMPPQELPEDLKAQLNAPPPELPEDIKKSLSIPPRVVTIEEVNTPPKEVEDDEVDE